jgi:predicted ferric reductase
VAISAASATHEVVELGSALGIVALTLLALQLVLPARMRVVSRPLGAEVAIRLHRHMADVLVAAIAAHVALVVVGDPSNLGLFDPLGAPWRAKAAVARPRPPGGEPAGTAASGRTPARQ